jgi:hypothetical protein
MELPGLIRLSHRWSWPCFWNPFRHPDVTDPIALPLCGRAGYEIILFESRYDGQKNGMMFWRPAIGKAGELNCATILRFNVIRLPASLTSG